MLLKRGSQDLALRIAAKWESGPLCLPELLIWGRNKQSGFFYERSQFLNIVNSFFLIMQAKHNISVGRIPSVGSPFCKLLK